MEISISSESSRISLHALHLVSPSCRGNSTNLRPRRVEQWPIPSVLHCPSGDQCCDALISVSSESSSSHAAPVACESVDHLNYSPYKPVYLPVHSLTLTPSWIRSCLFSQGHVSVRAAYLTIDLLCLFK